MHGKTSTQKSYVALENFRFTTDKQKWAGIGHLSPKNPGLTSERGRTTVNVNLDVRTTLPCTDNIEKNYYEIRKIHAHAIYLLGDRAVVHVQENINGHARPSTQIS